VPLARSTRRLLALLAGLPLVVLALGGIYVLAMGSLEGQSRTFGEGVEWASETLTTTGYGADAQWTHPLMIFFVTAVQFVGVFMVLLVFPIFVLPFFEERFEGRLPSLPPKLDGRVLIYRSGPAIRRLLEELDDAGQRVLVFEEDETTARALHRRGIPVAFGSLDDEGTIERIATASALVANGDDADDAALVLGMTEAGFEGRIVALVASPTHRRPMMLAGAHAVYTPLHVLAAEVVARVAAGLSPRLIPLDTWDERVALFQVRVHRDSTLAREGAEGLGPAVRPLASMVGGTWKSWNEGATIRPGDDLLVVAPPASEAHLARAVAPTRAGGRVVILGQGEVAGKAKELLEDLGREVIWLSPEDAPGVDRVGDPLDTRTLQTLEVGEAAAVVVVPENDREALFLAAVVRDFAPEVPIVAGLETGDDVARTRTAGADFAIALDDVTGRLLAHHLLERRPHAEPELEVVSRTAVGAGHFVIGPADDRTDPLAGGPAGSRVLVVRV
jgi:voltage-gated potassium channel Kch